MLDYVKGMASNALNLRDSIVPFVLLIGVYGLLVTQPVTLILIPLSLGGYAYATAK